MRSVRWAQKERGITAESAAIVPYGKMPTWASTRCDEAECRSAVDERRDGRNLLARRKSENRLGHLLGRNIIFLPIMSIESMIGTGVKGRGDG